MSDSCSRCEGPIGCVECAPDTIRLRTENRRMKRQLEQLGDAEKLLKENEVLKRELESSGKQLATACWPHDHEKKDLPEDVLELQKKIEELEKKWDDCRTASDRLRQAIRPAYTEVIREKKQSKSAAVFQLGVSIGEFLDEWFG